MVTIPSVPKKILDKLDSGVTVADCGMPTPSTGQILICKSHNASTDEDEIYTVTAGKTFYLMGIYTETKGTVGWWHLSLDGGTTVHFGIRGDEAFDTGGSVQKIAPGFPLAQVAAGVEITVVASSGSANEFLTIVGWEE